MQHFLRLSFVFLLLNIFFVFPIFSDDIKIQRVLDSGQVNTCITQDKDGLFWIGTEGGGLLCYDGNEIKKIDIGNKKPVQIIYSIFTDRDGLIWFFISDHGLYSYNKNTGVCTGYKPESGNSHSLTTDQTNWLPNIIAEDKEEFIWIGTADGLNSFDKKTRNFTQYKHNQKDENSLSNNNIWVVFVDKKGLIWIGTEDGLNCYNKYTGKFSCYRHDPKNSKSLSDNFVRAIVEDKEDNLWIGTKNTGIDKFDKKAGIFTNYGHDPKKSNSLSYNEIHHMMIDRVDCLWLCYENHVGIDRFNIKTNETIHYTYDSKNPNSISSDNILSSFEDNSGIIWFADPLGGINKCIPKIEVFMCYTYDPNISSTITSDDISGLYDDKRGNVWVGTFKGGLCLVTKDGFFRKIMLRGPNNNTLFLGNSIFSISDAKNDNCWLAVSDSVICLFDPDKKQILNSFKNSYQFTPCYLTQDNKNSNILWFASFFDNGLYNLNTTTGNFTAFKHLPGNNNSISSENTFHIFQDGDFLWLGTGGDGLCKFNKTTGTCTYYKHDPSNKDSISGNVVVESFIDSKGNFWVTTDDGGLNKFDKQTGKFTHYGIECGFPSKSTRHILEDKDGYLWISTDAGIVKFDSINGKVVRLFTTADGLITNKFDRFTAPLKDSKGNFWFSTKGICKFNPEEASKIVPNQHIPPIVLTSFKSEKGTYNENGIKKITDVKLKYPENSFEFTFAALDYMDPDKNQYAYMLEGFDKDWKYRGTNNFGEYANLRPGKYILHLKGSNSDGAWNETGTSISITILPPFWMTWQFGISCTLVLLGAGTASCYKWKKRRKKREIAKREHAVATAAVTVAHDLSKPFNNMVQILDDLDEFSRENLRELESELRLEIRKSGAILNDVMEASGQKRYNKTSNQNLLGVLDMTIKDVSHRYPKKNVNFYYQLYPIPLIYMDDLRMYRAFDNILCNAFDFLPAKDGFMWFSVKKTTPAFGHPSLAGGEHAKIIIGNSHSSIPEEKLKAIFEIGVSINKPDGTGFGLNIVRSVIKGHGGTVFARNVKTAADFVPEEVRNTRGVEFVITLPVTQEPGNSLTDPLLKSSEEVRISKGKAKNDVYFAEASLINSLRKKLESLKTKPNLLILDDESIYRMQVRNTLEKLDKINTLINVYDASSYKEAMDLVERIKIDYIICDIKLADEREIGPDSGFAVLFDTLKRNPNCRILIHTNRRNEADIEQALDLGACGFCYKPITEKVLVDLLLDFDLWPTGEKHHLKKAPKDKKRYASSITEASILVFSLNKDYVENDAKLFSSRLDPEEQITIHKATTYQEALNIIGKKSIDILFANCSRPGEFETEIKLCKYLKENNPAAVCVVATGSGEREAKEIKKNNPSSVDIALAVPFEPKTALNTIFDAMVWNNRPFLGSEE